VLRWSLPSIPTPLLFKTIIAPASPWTEVRAE
jgi:hypothetical protein